MSDDNMQAPPPRRGFAAMDPKVVRELGSRGGKKAAAGGRAHRWTKEQAREAGRKGGRALRARRDDAHFEELGKLGAEGKKRSELERASTEPPPAAASEGDNAERQAS